MNIISIVLKMYTTGAETLFLIKISNETIK